MQVHKQIVDYLIVSLHKLMLPPKQGLNICFLISMTRMKIS